MKKFLVVFLTAFLCTVSATASNKQTTCEKAYNVRQKVINKHGERAPGRNICRQGMRFKWVSDDKKHSHWFSRPAKESEKRDYLHAMKRLIAPAPPYLTYNAVQPGQPPAGTLSRSLAPSGLANCIVSHESGGNPQATNGQYHGIAQWSHEAWIRMGGGRYSSDPLGATREQQLQILSDGLARFGCNDWCPYDGC
jgi:hypothetical protein